MSSATIQQNPSSEAIEAAIKDLPRDPETTALYKHFANHRQYRHADGASTHYSCFERHDDERLQDEPAASGG
jgi:hypothetical protein